MPVDRGSMDAQLREIGEGERWWEQPEFRALPGILHEDERILGLSVGKLLGARRPRLRPSPAWLFVATSHRLICVKQERFARKQVEFAAGQITRITQSSRLRSYQIAIESPARRYRLRIPKADAFRFAAALAPLIPSPQLQRPIPELQSLSWIPGINSVAALPGVARIVSTVSLLSPPDYADREHLERLEATVERLQTEVERLQQQVAFLEDLLQTRASEALLLRSPADA
jgi:hypothetical protein